MSGVKIGSRKVQGLGGLALACMLVVAFLYFASDHSGHALSWRKLMPGVSHVELNFNSKYSLADFRLQALRFDLSRFSLRAADARTFGNGIKNASVSEMQRKLSALMAINGCFFDENDRPLGLVIDQGEVINPFRKADWGVLYVVDGRAHLVHTRKWKEVRPAKVDFAIQVGPRIIVDGKPTRLKKQVARRALVCIKPGNKELVFAVTDKGRAESNDLARYMKGLGCEQAVMMDGGPSAQMYAEIGDFKLDVPGGWPIPIGVAVVPRNKLK